MGLWEKLDQFLNMITRIPGWFIVFVLLTAMFLTAIFNRDLFFDLLPEFFGALTGVIMGYELSRFFTIRIKQSETIEMKKMVLSSLLAELEAQLKYLSQSQTIRYESYIIEAKTFVDVDYEILLTSSFDSAVSSGLFINLMPDLQVNISHYFNSCKIVNNRLINIYHNEYRIMMSRLRDALEIHSKLKTDCELLIKELEKELEQLK